MSSIKVTKAMLIDEDYFTALETLALSPDPAAREMEDLVHIWEPLSRGAFDLAREAAWDALQRPERSLDLRAGMQHIYDQLGQGEYAAAHKMLLELADVPETGKQAILQVQLTATHHPAYPYSAQRAPALLQVITRRVDSLLDCITRRLTTRGQSPHDREPD